MLVANATRNVSVLNLDGISRLVLILHEKSSTTFHGEKNIILTTTPLSATITCFNQTTSQLCSNDTYTNVLTKTSW